MSEQDKQRARREIRILKQLTDTGNPHIVKLIDSQETDAHIILIQEYVSGGQLVSFLKQRLNEQTALVMFKQLLSALECCHKNHIIHRDIKLENILLDENQAIKLIDFGVSNFMEEGVFRNTFCGTPAFASPEILLGEEYHGPEVDVWSIGVVLYYMLTCTYPFLNIGAILKGKFADPQASPACIDLIRRMLTREKSDRITLEQIMEHPWVRGLSTHTEFTNKVEPLETTADNLVQDKQNTEETVKATDCLATELPTPSSNGHNILLKRSSYDANLDIEGDMPPPTKQHRG